MTVLYVCIDLKLKRLKQLGYSPRLCREALIRTKGDFNASADWLVDNAYDEQVKVVDVVDDEKSESEKRFKIEAAGIEVGRRNMAQNVVSRSKKFRF